MFIVRDGEDVDFPEVTAAIVVPVPNASGQRGGTVAQLRHDETM